MENNTEIRECFILCGYWNTIDNDGLSMVVVTWDVREAEEELEKIRASNASEYIQFAGTPEVIESSRHVYEVRSREEKAYAKFCVMSSQLKLAGEQGAVL